VNELAFVGVAKLWGNAHFSCERGYLPLPKSRVVALGALGNFEARRKLWGRKRCIGRREFVRRSLVLHFHLNGSLQGNDCHSVLCMIYFLKLRLKNRWLLVELIPVQNPSPNTSPTQLDGQKIWAALKQSVVNNFGDVGWGSVGLSMSGATCLSLCLREC
jgi:hypothetical protein